MIVFHDELELGDYSDGGRMNHHHHYYILSLKIAVELLLLLLASFGWKNYGTDRSRQKSRISSILFEEDRYY